jgi:hypothetical protein
MRELELRSQRSGTHMGTSKRVSMSLAHETQAWDVLRTIARSLDEYKPGRRERTSSHLELTSSRPELT